MKPRYTVIVRDNDKKENVLELGAYGYNFTINTTYGYLTCNTRLNIDASVLLAEPEEKVTHVYEIDEDEITQEIMDCRYGHSLVTKMGLLKETTYCEKCGLEIKTDEV